MYPNLFNGYVSLAQTQIKMGSIADITERLLNDSPTRDTVKQALLLNYNDMLSSTADGHAARYIKYYYFDIGMEGADIYDKLEDTEFTDEFVESAVAPYKGNPSPSLSSLSAYYKMLAVIIKLLYYWVEDPTTLPFMKHYRDKMFELNKKDDDQHMSQRLTTQQQPRAVRPIEIYKNKLLLQLKETLNPRCMKTHLARLVYDLYLCCSLEHFTFRLDIVYSPRIADIGTVDGITRVQEYNKTHVNYFQFDSNDENVPITLVYNEDKNHRAGNSEKFVRCIPESFRPLLMYSLVKFPRELFVPGSQGKEHKSSVAARWLKSAWILDDRETKPGADDLRSSFITFFVMRHPVYEDKLKYVRDSGTSMYQMELAYNKTNDRLYELMLHEDGRYAASKFAGIGLTREEQNRVMEESKGKKRKSPG